MPTMFRRKATAEVIDTPAETDTGVAATPRAVTVSKRDKGVVTPKRGSATQRRGTAPPANRKAASAQTREGRRQQSRDQREAMARGEEWALMARDRGPEKKLARDIVDSRRSPSSYFMYVLIFVLLVSTLFAQKNPIIGFGVYVVFIFAIVAVAIDSYILSKKVKATIRERLPKGETRGLWFYCMMRAISFRRLRMPKPQVEVGAKI